MKSIRVGQGGGGSGTPVYPIKIRQNTQNNYTQVTYMVTPMYALYVTQQGLLVVSLTEEQGMKITLSFWISGVVPKTSKFLCPGKYNKYTGNQTARDLFWFCFYFSNESSRGPLIHSCWGISRPSAL